MNGSVIRQVLFALLTILGFVWTQYHLRAFLEWNAGEASLATLLRFNWAVFFSSGFANPGAAFLSVDAIIGTAAFLCWMFPEARKLGMRHAWIYLVLTFGVAFAVAFPAFLFMRERKLERLPALPPGDIQHE